MFATIECNGATHIAIHIPHAGAEKSLPALAAMLEQNAVFIQKGYQEAKLVKPTMAITLGDKFLVENYETEILVTAAGAVLDEGFFFATPEVLTSNAKALKKKDEEVARLRTELSFVKQEMQGLKDRLASMTEETNT